MYAPLVSLITVVYNGEKLLESTLQSGVGQTYPNIELVIIDGGSTDNTLDVAKKFSTHTGTLLSEKDRGIYDAMNKGIRAAKGEWLYFLNAGDSFYDAKVLKDIFSSPGVEHADFIYAKVQTLHEPSGIDYIAGEKVTINDFYSRYPICHQATFTRKSAFEKIGLFNNEYHLAADTEWFTRFFLTQPDKALFIDRIVAFYDIQGTTYHKRMQGYAEYLRFGRKLFPFAVTLRNYSLYPFLWLKVKIIRTFQQTTWFRKYRKMKFKNSLHSSK